MKNKKGLGILTILSLVMIFALASCMPKEEDYDAIEQQNIQQYLELNPTLNFSQKESGLYYLELTPGTGNVPGPHDTVSVFYTAKFLTGFQFDSNVGRDTLKFALGSNFAIPGFEEGLSYMNKGAKARIIIPSSLAYGPAGSYYVPGYTPLLFDLYLVKIKPGVAR
jgi:FKBP-type peptidyl-prolyl cis-trans isomerase